MFPKNRRIRNREEGEREGEGRDSKGRRKSWPEFVNHVFQPTTIGAAVLLKTFAFRDLTRRRKKKKKRERERKSNLRSFSVTKAEKLRYIEKEEIHLTRIVKVESTRP